MKLAYSHFVLIVFSYGMPSYAGYNASSCRKIQELINNAPQSNGGASVTVQIPPGNYICREPIFIERSHINIVGGGGVNIKLADNANAPVLVIGSRHTARLKDPVTGKEDFFTVAADGSQKIKVVKNVSVSGLNIDGNKDKQRFECWTPNTDQPIRKPKEPISNSTCSGTGPSAIRNNGITIRGAEDIKVSDVVLDNNASGGMVTEKHVARLNVTGMKARNNWFDGFAGYQTTDSVIQDSELTNNLGAGASLDLHFNNNTFLRTKLSNNAHQGVFARELSGNKWIDSDISCNGYQGIFLASSHSGPIDTARLRVESRKLGYPVSEDLSLSTAFYRDIIKNQSSTPSDLIPMDLILRLAKEYSKTPEMILEEIYMKEVEAKRARCANSNSFVNTNISCSGTQTPSWGAGLRINDDECAGNCIDNKTLRKFEAQSGDQKNKAGDIAIGTIGEIPPDSLLACPAQQNQPVQQEQKTENTLHSETTQN